MQNCSYLGKNKGKKSCKVQTSYYNNSVKMLNL